MLPEFLFALFILSGEFWSRERNDDQDPYSDLVVTVKSIESADENTNSGDGNENDDDSSTVTKIHDTYNVHKLKLGRRSGYFDSIFRSSLCADCGPQTSSCDVILHPLVAPQFGIILTYIYTPEKILLELSKTPEEELSNEPDSRKDSVVTANNVIPLLHATEYLVIPGLYKFLQKAFSRDVHQICRYVNRCWAQAEEYSMISVGRKMMKACADDPENSVLSCMDMAEAFVCYVSTRVRWEDSSTSPSLTGAARLLYSFLRGKPVESISRDLFVTIYKDPYKAVFVEAIKELDKLRWMSDKVATDDFVIFKLAILEQKINPRPPCLPLSHIERNCVSVATEPIRQLDSHEHVEHTKNMLSVVPDCFFLYIPILVFQSPSFHILEQLAVEELEKREQRGF
mmetsp:Transcript_44734/g.108479  ORF Transcript_44734/g.108479 Transcript_44734/m.108479 type:complete len:399 (-) Transcript_44734:2367-3563(-)